MPENGDQNNISSIFQNWVDEYADTLYSWALHKTSNQQLAEDLVQDTFVAAYRAYKNYREDSTPKTWLLSILNNKIIDHYRKHGRNPIVNEADISGQFSTAFERNFDENGNWKSSHEPHSWQNAEDLLDDEEFKMILEHCMAKLPDNWNSAVSLKYLEGKKGDAISKVLGISTSNYWQIIHRAKIVLRECIDKLWFNK